MSAEHDVITLGAALLPTRDLVRLMARRLTDVELDTAVHALSLTGCARDAALRSHRAGPALMAALEIGRRAWLLPSPRGRRVRGPTDVASVLGPHASDAGSGWLACALDVRMRVARITAVDGADAGAVLRAVLSAGCARMVVVHSVAGPAVPSPDHVDGARALADAARTVGVHLVDVVLLGDDGVASLVRLGLLQGTDARYR